MKEEVMHQIYSIAHDIKAPLNSIKGLIQLSRIATEEEKLELFEKMNNSVGTLENFIQSMLDNAFSKHQTVENQNINLKALIDECVDLLQWMDIESKPQFEIEILDYSEFVQEEWQLKRVLHNILSNAIKYRQKGRPLLISIKAVTLPSKTLIHISDNGRGMNAEQVEHIFERFSKMNNGITGHGLGMSIVKDALDKIGGNINVKSSPYIGTHFLLEIPNYFESKLENTALLCAN